MRTYNGAPAHTDVIAAGTQLWRVHRTDSRHPANSFNSTNIAPLVDALTIDPRRERIPQQGRFDPVHDDTVCPGGSRLGGYLYVGLSVGAVVAEGILRSTDIPKSGILSAAHLSELSMSRMILQQDVIVAVLDTQPGLTALNQNNSLTGCTWREYGSTRTTCTAILVAAPAARGVRYRCSNGFDARSLLLVERTDPPTIEVERTGDLVRPGWARDLVEESLFVDFGVVLDRP
ncbi:hypothetical protein [Rhodococcus tukisamuensis]|uniref:RES domain-containing protein n=1 Tax=Rhodococcus tukisamuensis TaxID=168276 RepID=A0A1G6MNI7_9NOCA|nr:hypothetical protein [Rhodococcus tukisamuensis]SDC56535.1 hypothetical protein SAMN05444580_101231 [Rhodococcus tukisamuensis]